MATEPTRILVPAYDYPGPALGQTPRDWDVLLDVGKKMRMGDLLVVASPDRGPGWDDNGYTPPDANYEFEIKRLRGICASVVGYVTDCYANTKVGEGPDAACPRVTPIADDIDRWFDIYKVHGIFVDEVDSDNVAHAQEIVRIVRRRINKALIVLNPGVVPSEDFMVRTDPAIVIIHENALAAYEGWPGDSAKATWLRNREGASPQTPGYFPARRLAIIAHTPENLTGKQAIDRIVSIADMYDIGWVYISHTVGPVYNPLSTLLPELGNRIAGRISFPPRPVRDFLRPIVCKSQDFFTTIRTSRT